MKYGVLKFFIFVGIVGIIASSIGAKMFEDDRAMSIAAARASEISISDYSPDMFYALADEEELYRNLCVVGIVASVLLTSACTVAHVAGKSADGKKANATTNTTTNSTSKQPTIKDKLTELESLKNNKLITEKEYVEMRKEILATIRKD